MLCIQHGLSKLPATVEFNRTSPLELSHWPALTATIESNGTRILSGGIVAEVLQSTQNDGTLVNA